MEGIRRDEMKNQTIGVEIEMNNITREHAAEVAAEYFGTNHYRYEGGSYMTWVAYDAQGRKWKMMYDSSISGENNKKCECVTPILHYEDIELLQGLVRKLRAAGAKSSPHRGCGVHVHIGADGHTPKTLRNLVNIMAGHETLLTRAVGIDDSRLWRWCKVVDREFLRQVNAKKPATMEAFADIWYRSQHASADRYAHYNSSRYHMLNLHATFTKGTIEFRAFQFDNWVRGKHGNGLHAGKLKAYIQFCLAVSNYAKCVNRATSREPVANIENPKYAMRLWLFHMGLIGDEYKTCRQHLLEKLPGNATSRYTAGAVGEMVA